MNKKYSYISNIRYEDGQKGNCHRIECITRLSSPYPSLWTDLSREITLPPSDPSSKGWRERKTWKTSLAWSGIERRKRRHSYYGNWWMDRLWSIFVESRVESRRFFITCRRGGIVFRVESWETPSGEIFLPWRALLPRDSRYYYCTSSTLQGFFYVPAGVCVIISAVISFCARASACVGAC